MRHKWIPERTEGNRAPKKWLCACGISRQMKIEKLYYYDATGKFISMEPPRCTRAEPGEARAEGQKPQGYVLDISVDLFVDGKFGSATGKLAGTVPTRYVTMHVCPVVALDDVYSVAVVTGNFDRKIGNVRMQGATTEIEWFPHSCNVPHESLSHMLRLICAAMTQKQNAA